MKRNSSFHTLIAAAVVGLMLMGFGCSTSPSTPAQAVYVATSSLAAAETLMIQYKALPPCEAPDAPKLCSDASVVSTLKSADEVAYESLKAAQVIVRTPGAGLNVATVVQTATQAVQVLMELTAKLVVK